MKKITLIYLLLFVLLLGCLKVEEVKDDVNNGIGLKRKGANVELISETESIAKRIKIEGIIKKENISAADGNIFLTYYEGNNTFVDVVNINGKIELSSSLINIIQDEKLNVKLEEEFYENDKNIFEKKSLLNFSEVPELLGDFTGDGKVDLQDLNVLAENYYSNNEKCDIYPANKGGIHYAWQDIYCFKSPDDIVDIFDLITFALNYNKEKPIDIIDYSFTLLETNEITIKDQSLIKKIELTPIIKSSSVQAEIIEKYEVKAGNINFYSIPKGNYEIYIEVEGYNNYSDSLILNKSGIMKVNLDKLQIETVMSVEIEGAKDINIGEKAFLKEVITYENKKVENWGANWTQSGEGEVKFIYGIKTGIEIEGLKAGEVNLIAEKGGITATVKIEVKNEKIKFSGIVNFDENVIMIGEEIKSEIILKSDFNKEDIYTYQLKADGVFEFGNLLKGKYFYIVNTLNGKKVSGEIDLSIDTDLEIAVEVDNNKYNLQGQVFDVETKELIKDGEILLQPFVLDTIIESKIESGVYNFGNQESWAYGISVNVEGYKRKYIDKIYLTEDKVIDIYLEKESSETKLWISERSEIVSEEDSKVKLYSSTGEGEYYIVPEKDKNLIDVMPISFESGVEIDLNIVIENGEKIGLYISNSEGNQSFIFTYKKTEEDLVWVSERSEIVSEEDSKVILYSSTGNGKYLIYYEDSNPYDPNIMNGIPRPIEFSNGDELKIELYTSLEIGAKISLTLLSEDEAFEKNYIYYYMQKGMDLNINQRSIYVTEEDNAVIISSLSGKGEYYITYGQSITEPVRYQFETGKEISLYKSNLISEEEITLTLISEDEKEKKYRFTYKGLEIEKVWVENRSKVITQNDNIAVLRSSTGSGSYFISYDGMYVAQVMYDFIDGDKISLFNFGMKSGGKISLTVYGVDNISEKYEYIYE